MTDTPQVPPRASRLRELVVPALMLGGIALYLGDSLHLSTQVLILPLALIVVVAASLVWALAEAFLSKTATIARATDEEGEDETRGPILDPRPWLLVALPAALIVLMGSVGALVAFVAVVFGAELILSVRSPVRSLAIAAAVTLPTYALFKYVLYVRFPAGLLGLG
jgi:hypothetical protein